MKRYFFPSLALIGSFLVIQAAVGQAPGTGRTNLEAEIDLRLSGMREEDIGRALVDSQLWEQGSRPGLGDRDSILQAVDGVRVAGELANIPPEHELSDLAEEFRADIRAAPACSIAAGKWISELAAIGASNPDMDWGQLLQIARLSAGRNFLTYAATYESSCLSKIEELPTDLVEAGIKSIVGVLYSPDFPRCMALRIEVDTFVTARHCFYSAATGARQVRPDSMRLALLSDLNTGYPFIEARGQSINFSGEIKAMSDYIFLTVPQGVGRPELPVMPELELGFVESADQLLLLGYYQFHSIGTLLRNAGAGPFDPAWRDGIRWSGDAMCKFFEVVPPCGVHYCQTSSRFSGTPMIKRETREGKLVVVAQHIGTVASARSDCRFTFAQREGNVAINIPWR